MHLENNLMVMTPAEADYFETTCMYREHDEAATDLKWRIRDVELTWALSVLPPDETIQGIQNGFAFTKGRALLKYGESTDECISIQLSGAELTLITRLAIEKTAGILERAGKFESLTELHKKMPLEDGEFMITEEQDEAIKASMFEQDLKYLAIGYSVLSVLLNRE